MGTIFLPHEAHPPLIIDADTVLSFALVFQRLQAVPWRHSQAVQLGGGVELEQLPPCNPFDVLESGHVLALE
jgi:hypothetical protein